MFILIVVMMVPVCVNSQGMGMCPVRSNISVSLSSSYKQDGRAFACPGEVVTFICEVNRSTSVQIAAETFICREDPVIYLATDLVGNLGGTEPNDVFRANLTHVQREGNTLMAYYNTTLITTVTNETANTTVECSDQLTMSARVQRINLIESQTPPPPPGLNYRLESDNCSCIRPVIGAIAINCTCRVTNVLLFWEEPEASGVFDVGCYVVTVAINSMVPTIPQDICNTAFTVSSDVDIMTTTSTNFDFPISPGVNYSVLVWTVSRCGQLSDPAEIPMDDEFLSIEEHLATQTLPGPIIETRTVNITSPILTTPNIVLVGVGGALLGVAVLISTLRFCFIELQERLFKWLFAIERVLTGCSLLMIVIAVFLLLLNINEPCDENCHRVHDTTTSLFFVFSFISAVVSGVITGFRLYRYRIADGLVFQHPKYIKIEEKDDEIPLTSRITADSGMEPESETANEGKDDLHTLKVENTKSGKMLVVVVRSKAKKHRV